MILWVTNLDRKRIAIPIQEISYFFDYRGNYTQTLIYLKSGLQVECTENIDYLTNKYEAMLGK